ncbi:2-amino-4-hydroxy-6-hydroxymethyldihydropteridine pyrophosphokinase [Profundibacterium mesophilum KAUST100406-0324]|uniref:2-amino-4-hydroxy-6-hydroxymethyldihydropteridine pyrophosphokinase n=2 Tax=Profundibacterium TaxID=1258570 RepID=A0A921TCZ4_9RHOB|nr:2-amino-4-hydroxy-6-hydroxymethyldihydropteridine pyrophosphokinase [Profundibacterium mesophilum KAUST100406-0324]
MLRGEGFDLVNSSYVYKSIAVPAGSGPDFLNAVARFTVTMGPRDCLASMHRAEAAAGRVRLRRWAPRTLDLDLLDMDGMICPDLAGYAAWRDMPPERQAVEAPGELILPHPRLHERGFVLIPWADVAPDWRHPVTGSSVTEMRDALPAEARAGVERLAGGPLAGR